jgi:exodeoxyribonuclease VII small subunit
MTAEQGRFDALPAAGSEGDTFEALYARLEEVTARLEEGNLTLEDSITLYEEGMQLAQRCQALLAQVEQRIETLRETYDNGFEL